MQETQAPKKVSGTHSGTQYTVVAHAWVRGGGLFYQRLFLITHNKEMLLTTRL